MGMYSKTMAWCNSNKVQYNENAALEIIVRPIGKRRAPPGVRAGRETRGVEGRLSAGPVRRRRLHPLRGQPVRRLRGEQVKMVGPGQRAARRRGERVLVRRRLRRPPEWVPVARGVAPGRRPRADLNAGAVVAAAARPRVAARRRDGPVAGAVAGGRRGEEELGLAERIEAREPLARGATRVRRAAAEALRRVLRRRRAPRRRRKTRPKQL